MTQSAKIDTPLGLAAASIVIAAASNNLVKGVYAYALSERKTGIQSAVLLFGLAIMGLLPLVWI